MSDGTWFAGDHGPDGVFGSLKGSALAPHVQQPMTSNAMGDSRHIDSAGGTDWTGSILVTTGMTRGSGNKG